MHHGLMEENEIHVLRFEAGKFHHIFIHLEANSFIVSG